jgi:hypothetical protein
VRLNGKNAMVGSDIWIVSKANPFVVLKLMVTLTVTDKMSEERCGLPLQNKWRAGDEVDG